MRAIIFLPIAISLILISNAKSLGIDCTISPCEYDGDSIRFYILGDWGGRSESPYTTKGQMKCANLTMDMGRDKKPHFFISTGDNFYEYGVQHAEDARFKTTFDDVFLYGKEKKIPWYVTQGNHDWYGNGTAQVAYTELNDRWVCPDFTFTASYNSTVGPSVDMVFIDTIILCGNTWNETDDDADYVQETGKRGKKIKQYLGPKDPERAERMWNSAEHQLAKSKADYLFVIGHYPIFSATRHNISDCLMPRLQDMLEKYNASAYISGHAHNLQHTTTRHSGRTLHHIVSGAAHLINANYKNIFDDLSSNPWNVKSMMFFPKKKKGVKKERDDMGGLIYARLGRKSGLFEYHKCDGTFLYGFEMRSRN